LSKNGKELNENWIFSSGHRHHPVPHDDPPQCRQAAQEELGVQAFFFPLQPYSSYQI